MVNIPFFTYIRERFDGFESRPGQKMNAFEQEVSAFPEYYAQYFKEAMMRGAILYIANVKAAAKAAGIPHSRIFLPATAPSGVGINEYYRTEEAIVAAGLLQVDDPFLPDIFVEPGVDEKQRGDVLKSMWKRRMPRSMGYPQNVSGFTPVTASTRGLGSTEQICPR